MTTTNRWGVWVAAVVLALRGAVGAEAPAAAPSQKSEPREIRVVFDEAAAGSDIITVEAGQIATITATLTNVSSAPVVIMGTGSTPNVLTPSGRKLEPGEKMQVSLLVTPNFAPFPISVSVGAVYKAAGSERLIFSNGHARVAPVGAVIPSTERVAWLGAASDERVVKVALPDGSVLKDVLVQGDFVARVEGKSVLVRPRSPVTGDGANQSEARRVPSTGSMQLVIEPPPAFRVAPISLVIQPPPSVAAERNERGK